MSPLRRTIVLPVVAALMLAACGSGGPQDGEDYGDLLASPGGLLVREEEHPTGWGRPDCVTCHELRSAHIENRTGLPNCQDVPPATPCIDLDAIQNIIRAQGQSSCMQCHGNNGV